MTTIYKSPLHKTTMTSPTRFWNDSCAIDELMYAIEHGAVGATSNPTIVLSVLKKELPVWRDRIRQMIDENPNDTEDQITWKIVEEMAAKASRLLLPIFEETRGKRGRLSLQTNPTFYRNAQAIVEQASHFHTLAPNLNTKIPATKAGIAAAEELTYLGVSINVTVSFTVPQALAAAEAIERGLNRRAAEGKSIAEMSPVVTIMIGRLDDWMHVLAARDTIITDPGYLNWAGIAAIKKAYHLFKERNYRSTLLAAAYRHHMHWSELIGGDLSLTIPYEWQLKFNASDIEVKSRIDDPIPAAAMSELMKKFPDFRRAYAEDGLTIDEFDTYGATIRTLRTFIGSYRDLLAVIRDFMLPNPDVR